MDYRALETDHPGFSEVAAWQTSTVTVLEPTSHHASRITAKAVTGSYCPLLRQRSLIGRRFDRSDDVVRRGSTRRRCSGRTELAWPTDDRCLAASV